MSKQQKVATYMRVGSEAQCKPSLKDKLEAVGKEIANEEKVMKTLAADFHKSSERYNKLRMKQRSLTVQLYKEASGGKMD